DSIQNEWLCGQFLAALGLPVARSEIARFNEQLVMVVERFDREWRDDNSSITRLPQEDFCQALGCPPARKYESDGGPSMAECLRLLEGSNERATDLVLFQLAQLSFWLLAAADGHAKNFSIFMRAGGSYDMTPLYDVMSIWPYIGDKQDQWNWFDAKLAMAIRSRNVHWKFNEIQARHWRGLALKNGGNEVWEEMKALVDRVEEALAEVGEQLPPHFPDRIWTPIAEGVQRQAQTFRRQAAMLAD